MLAIQSLLSYVALLLETNLVPIGAAMTMLTGLGAAISMGIMTGKAVEAIARQPEAAGKVRASLMLGLAFAEMTSLLAFVIAIFIVNGG